MDDWERRETPEGTPYWVNHTTQTTQWEQPPPPPYSAQPVHAVAQPVVAQVAAPPVVVSATPVVQSTVVSAPAPVVSRSAGSGSVAYQPPRGTAVATSAEPQKRGSFSGFFSRAAALTKTATVGKFAPSRLKKAGVLTLDGHRRFVRLADGLVTIFESEAAEKADEKLVIFRAPIHYVKVLGYGPKNKQGPTEIQLFVEPEALNQEMNAQNRSDFGGFGWHPMHLRVGRQAQETGYTGDVKRQNFSLYCKDKAEKHAWFTTLNTVCSSAREWAYVRHEVKDAGKYMSGKKK